MKQKEIANISLVIALVIAVLLIIWYRDGQGDRWLEPEQVEEVVIEEAIID